MLSQLSLAMVLAALAAAPSPIQTDPEAGSPAPVAPAEPALSVGVRSPSAALLATLGPPPLRSLAAEAVERNPAIARVRARAAAAAVRAPQVASLPDPMAGLTLFLLPPETRVGPQRFSLSVSQKLPWLAKLDLAERAAVLDAAAADAAVEAERLRTITRVRHLFYELAFEREQIAILEEERQHLVRHEEAARARYAVGRGLQQAVVKIQAEITRLEAHLLGRQQRQTSLAAELNALRDRPAVWPIDEAALPAARRSLVDPRRLIDIARQNRPELLAAGARIAAAEERVELAEKRFKPDFQLGLAYTFVDDRQDAPGRANPPPDDGDDIVALNFGVELPVRRARLEAGLAEALAEVDVARQERRQTETEIARTVGDIAARMPLLIQQYRLLHGVLRLQAEEALSSAEAAYTAGEVGALDLLDSEHILFEVRSSTGRTLADLAIAWAELEAAVGAPIPADASLPVTEERPAAAEEGKRTPDGDGPEPSPDDARADDARADDARADEARAVAPAARRLGEERQDEH